MRSVAWTVLLSFVIGLAVLTAGMFAFVLAVAPGQCNDPQCLAVQTYSPGQTVTLPSVEPTGTEVPAPPVVPPETGSPAASPTSTP